MMEMESTLSHGHQESPLTLVDLRSLLWIAQELLLFTALLCKCVLVSMEESALKKELQI